MISSLNFTNITFLRERDHPREENSRKKGRKKKKNFSAGKRKNFPYGKGKFGTVMTGGGKTIQLLLRIFL